MIDKENITHEGLIAKHFNTYFAQIRTKLEKTIETSSIKFRSFMKKCDSMQPESPLSVNELKDVYLPFRINKGSDYDEISLMLSGIALVLSSNP